MKIKAIKLYNDKLLSEIKEIGDEYEVSDERGNELIKAGYAVEVKSTEINEIKEIKSSRRNSSWRQEQPIFTGNQTDDIST